MAGSLTQVFTATTVGAEGAGATITTGSKTSNAGSLITVSHGAFAITNAGTLAESDSKSNSYTQAFSNSLSGDNTVKAALSYNANGTRGATHTVSGNQCGSTGGGPGHTVGGQEWGGIDTTPTVTTGTGSTTVLLRTSMSVSESPPWFATYIVSLNAGWPTATIPIGMSPTGMVAITWKLCASMAVTLSLPALVT